MKSIFNEVGILVAAVPPFSLQPLVENAVQHGLHSSPQPGRLSLVARETGSWLEMTVSDDGQGVPATEIEQCFFADHKPVHALVLLRRRLKGLCGRSFQLAVRSEIGEGTTVIIRIPLRADSKSWIACGNHGLETCRVTPT